MIVKKEIAVYFLQILSEEQCTNIEYDCFLSKLCGRAEYQINYFYSTIIQV